jgi:tight adherence protein B
VLLIILLIFIAVFLIVLAIYLNVAAAKDSPKAELKRRLRQVALTGGRDAGSMTTDLRSEIVRETPPLVLFLSKVPFLRGLEGRIDRSGLTISLQAFLLITLGLGVVGFAICYILSKNLILSLAVTAVLFAIPFIFIEFKKRQREDKFTELFPDALTMMARSIRSGHSFASSIDLVGKEVSDPVGSLFKMAYDQQMLGLRINDTLNNMNNRINSIDLRFFTTAVAINSEVGGNFAEILDKLADTIRERLKIKRQLRVYTAQARLSGYILAVLPIIMFFVMNFLIPGYQKVLLENQKGLVLLVVVAVLQVIGFFVIRKIINIRI